MKLYEWTNLYERAVALANGDRPGIELEGRIVERFEEDPERVERAIERIGASYQRGDVRGFWPVLDADLAAPSGPRFQTTATAKTPSPWKITNEFEEPDLPEGPRELPAFVKDWRQERWPEPVVWDGEDGAPA